eukprot:6179568-Pleurochrysis_carterae.AAC.1
MRFPVTAEVVFIPAPAVVGIIAIAVAVAVAAVVASIGEEFIVQDAVPPAPSWLVLILARLDGRALLPLGLLLI